MEERDEKSSRECDSDNVGRGGAEIWLRRSETIRMMRDSSQALIKDRSVSWKMAEEVIVGQRCSCRATPGSWFAPVGAAMLATTSTCLYLFYMAKQDTLLMLNESH